MSASGRPVLVNCGGYFVGVEAYDRASGRLVWSATRDADARYGVDEIEIGVLPEPEWVESSRLSISPIPEEWRFVITMRDYDVPWTFEVDHHLLSQDAVVLLESGERVSAERFMGKTCGYDPLIPPAMTFSAVAAGGLFVAVALVANGKRRTASPANPPASWGRPG